MYLDFGNPDLWQLKVHSDASHTNISNGSFRTKEDCF